jgi:hypothetical protein
MTIKINKISEELNYEKEAAEKIPSWLQPVINVLIKDPKETAQQKAKARASYIDNINNVLYKKQRFATVEDKVKYMRERVGLDQYLSKIKAEQNTKIIREANGKLTVEAAKSIVAQINSIPKFPKTLEKSQNAKEAIQAFINSSISGIKGMRATIPQLQYDILSVFGKRFGLAPQDVENDDVIIYLNHCIVQERAKLPPQIEEHIPDGVGQDLSLDEDNRIWDVLNS